MFTHSQEEEKRISTEFCAAKPLLYTLLVLLFGLPPPSFYFDIFSQHSGDEAFSLPPPAPHPLLLLRHQLVQTRALRPEGHLQRRHTGILPQVTSSLITSSQASKLR